MDLVNGESSFLEEHDKEEINRMKRDGCQYVPCTQ